ncbi:sodium:solute symporter family protein [Sulfobacillus thermosulfidooxidans]|uniref:sodium:solute symporter family protein n=1 Tax=Sulfobacillus thermosulfidooxidans TaxID=28034 RepID=UPI00030D2FEB|nr:sodium:solute symporter family protein [Sulfobacillus thermosulfidooxidans]OLZ11656.1 sodium:solute symporter [Sulfobacillus thermosulfidooxidans]OLZ18619.1 sodium:solute symporter [Sulfobacillus thermosulfidooxidans]OLZ20302.1 sodium:solute symporter [Sulfobacillus thermosulfidooxidans]
METVIVSAAVAVILLTILGMVTGAKESQASLAGWLVHRRNMGPWLIWFLLGTEIYTAFTFQGLAGYAYVKGGPVFYNVALNDVAYALGFMILPLIWILGRRFRYVTQADFVAGRYQSKTLGSFVALTTAIIMIAYIDLNITGLGAIFHVISRSRLSVSVSDIIGFFILALAVYVGGIRGNAWQSVIKDIFMIVALGTLFIVFPYKDFHGFEPMFKAFGTQLGQVMTLPGKTHNAGLLWLVTTVIMTGLGQWMWPQWFGVAYTAKSPRALKIQAVFMPLYQLVKVAVIIIGFGALIVLGRHQNGNDVVLILARRLFPTPFFAFFVVAAIFAALVPAGPIIMTSASLIAKNVWGDLTFRTEQQIYRLTKMLVFPLTALALFLALATPSLLVAILLVAYDFIAQLFPAIVIGGLFWRGATKYGAFWGMIVGWVVDGSLLLSHHSIIWGMNAGFMALVLNTVVFWVVSRLTYHPQSAEIQHFTALYGDAPRTSQY